ncbi:MAG: GtrA family protein [Solirubrobacteraceae bacterium]
MSTLAEFIRQHPWWQRMTRTPFSAKMTKYALSSVLAFGLSNLTFAFAYWLGWDTTICSVVAFIAAAIPNWIMNRRWAWKQKGRAPFRQIMAYAGVSAVVLVVTSLATGWTNAQVQSIPQHHGVRLLIVTGSFVVVTVVLFFIKFVIYEFVIFSERGRLGLPASTSRANVSKIARANRIP